MENLKDKDVHLHEAIEQHYRQTGFMLSLAEGAEAMGMSKGSVIADMFKRLEAAGAIEYNENRKACRPTNWRELAGQTPAPDPVDVDAEVERRVQESRAFLDAEFERRVAKEVKKKLKSGSNDQLEQIRKATRDRVRRHREKQLQNK